MLALAYILIVFAVIIASTILSVRHDFTTTTAGLFGTIVGICGTGAFHNGSGLRTRRSDDSM